MITILVDRKERHVAGNMVSAKVTIRGTRPMLWHHFGPEALPLEKQEKKGVAGNDPTEWRRTHLATSDGQLYIEPTYIFACARDGARHTKRGRGSIMTMVAATLQVVDSQILLDRYVPEELSTDPEQAVYLDIRGVRNPSTRARNVRYRVAASPGWGATFHIVWDKTVVSRDEMHSVFIDAGKLCGIGNGRGIGFGRFEVEDFEVEEDAQEQTAA
jgi:hypothetical protein